MPESNKVYLAYLVTCIACKQAVEYQKIEKFI